MHSVLKRLLFFLLISLVLVACGTTTQLSSEENSNTIHYVASVDIDSSTTQAELTSQYGGEIVTFLPEAGFAVLGFNKQEGELTTLTTSINQDALASPEATASGFSSWAGGFSAWAGGFSAWAGGFSAWAGGWRAWAGGDTAPTPPIGNDALWQQIKLYEAHDNAVNFGDGVTVAVLDTGIDLKHEIFKGRLVPSSQWKDFVDNDNYPQERGTSSDIGYGHGTAVAGLIVQVAPKAKILPIRVLDKDGKGDLNDVVEAIDHAVSMGADIINLSLGTFDYSFPLEMMINYAAENQVLMVASTGNEGRNTSTFPAQFSWYTDDSIFSYLFGVGSINSSKKVSSFSNRGAHALTYVMGESVVSAYPGNRLTRASGTSFSAPVFTGALALALSDSQADPSNLYIYMASTGYWPSNFDGSNYGVLDVNGLVASVQNKAGYNLLGQGKLQNFNFWDSQTNASITDKGMNKPWGSNGAVISAKGGFSQVVTGLKPNTTYTFGGYLKVANANDRIRMSVKNHGGTTLTKWVSNTGWAYKEITFTTGATNTSAEVVIWYPGSNTAFADEFELKRK